MQGKKKKYNFMSIQFLYEDGNGTVVDEYGRPEAMHYIVDEEQYVLEQ